MKKLTLILLMLILLGITNVFAQQTFTLLKQKSSVKVTGTSSLHDWEMVASELSGKIILKAKGQGIEGFEDADFSVKAKTLISNSSIMDGKAHEALKAGKHPEIKFNMTSVDLKNSTQSSFNGTVNGNLSVAGKTKAISIPFDGKTMDSNTLMVAGIKSLKMSDFGIDPPRAMLGTLRTGDEIKVIFNFEFTSDPHALVNK